MLKDRNDLLENKKAEIISIIEKTSISLGEEDISSKDIMQSFLNSGGLLMTPPQQEPPMLQMMTMDSLSNIKLNIRHLIRSLPDLTAAAVEIATDIPILKVCAALNIWKMLRDITTVKITKEQAIVVMALWENCDQKQRIALEKGFECFNSLHKNIEKSECTWEQYMKLIGDLERLGSLELDENGIWLREWVSKQYRR